MSKETFRLSPHLLVHWPESRVPTIAYSLPLGIADFLLISGALEWQGDRRNVSCYPYSMPRMARISIANIPHHVTQRGNAGQFLLATDSEKNVYLRLLQKYLRLYSVALAGYCLMSNHVHLILVPSEPDALAVALKQIHGRFASFWNATHCSNGHVWQGRFYSCPLDDAHLWIALRYVERNPVRAQLAHRPEHWKWSSAAVHCGTQIAPSWLAMDKFSRRWTAQTWTNYAAEIESDAHLRDSQEHSHRQASRSGGIRT